MAATFEDDDDDLTYSKEYRESEADMLLPAKEADFRTFLCDSGATEEIVRLLVGLAESTAQPADPVAYLRAKFDAQELPDMVSGKQRDDASADSDTDEAEASEVEVPAAKLTEATPAGEACEAEAAVPLEAATFASQSSGEWHVAAPRRM